MIVVILGIAFYFSMVRLMILQRRKRRAFETLQVMEEDGALSRLYLKIQNGMGDFYDIHVKPADGGADDADLPLVFNNQVLTPALLLPEGSYMIGFKVKIHEFPMGYVSGKGPFACLVQVRKGEDSILTSCAAGQRAVCAVRRNRYRKQRAAGPYTDP